MVTFGIIGVEAADTASIILVTQLPRATRALVASWLIQKETHDNMTMSIDGRYV